MRTGFYTRTDGAATSTAVCAACKQQFKRGADEGWKRLCIGCWKASQGDDAYQRGFDAGVAAEARAHTLEVRRTPSTPSLDATTVRRLLQLCHPDKHGGSALATEVTTWLLAVKRGGT